MSVDSDRTIKIHPFSKYIIDALTQTEEECTFGTVL